MNNTTRRDLLKGGALAGLAGMVGCKTPNGTQPGEKSETPQKTQAHWQAPPAQKGNDLNLIVLVSDSFRADNLAVYGSNWVETPNLNDCPRFPSGASFIPVAASSPLTFTSSRIRSSCQDGMSSSSRMSLFRRRWLRQATKRH